MNKTCTITLAGGGIKGARLIGALRALSKFPLDIKAVSGTSIGALIGAAFVSGKLDEAEMAIRSLRNLDDMLGHHLFGMVEGYFKGGLFTNQKVSDILDKVYSEQALRLSRTELITCTIDYHTSEKVYFRTKKMVPDWENAKSWILASAALNICFPPQEIGNRKFLDGGTREPIPVRVVAESYPDVDYHFIFCLDVSPKEADIEHIDVFKSMGRTISILLDERNRDDVERGMNYWSKDPNKFIVIKADDIFNNVIDVDPIKIDKSIKDGFDTTYNILDKLMMSGKL